MLKPIRVGTRGSPLAMAQTQLIVKELKERNPAHEFKIQRIRTEGDEDYKSELGTSRPGKDAFTKKIEQKLLEGEIDLAVHSLKDLPSTLPQRLSLAAVPKRDDPRDVLVSRGRVELRSLPKGERLGTSSLRRRVQILAVRPDLEVVEIHGNIGTRISNMETNGLKAIILAAAGLSRLGMSDQITEFLSTDIVLPAPGQGALAVEARHGDDPVDRIARSIDDPDTRLATDAERAFSEQFGGGCNLPLAAYARIQDTTLLLEGMIAAADGTGLLREKIVGEKSNPKILSVTLAEKMLAKRAVNPTE